MASSKSRKKEKPSIKTVLDQSIKQGNSKRIHDKNENCSKNSWIRTYTILILAFSSGFVHRYHVSTLFENDRHFSHLSTLEREMTFRSEMGLYYSFYKTIVEADTFSNGIDQIVFNNLTEYPTTINTLERFNLLPEVVIGGLFRIFEWVCITLNVSASECWQVDRGRHMPPVLSCEGYRQPEYFYLEVVWLSAALTGIVLFLYGVLISESIIGGLITVLCFFYNHGESTRVQWTPPLRESFAYPICLLHMYIVTWCIKSNVNVVHSLPSIIKHKFQLALIVTTTCLCLLLWQFSQFFIATQVIALLLMFAMGFITKFSLYIILLGEFFGVVQAVFLLFGNQMLISSLLLSLLVSSVISLKIVYPVISTKTLPRTSAFICTIVTAMLTVALKKWIMNSNDDGHITNLLLSKLTDYKDFHTLLYTCSAEYDFLGWEPIVKMTMTWILPMTIFILCLLAFHFFTSPNKLSAVDPHIIYNVAQMAAFAIMAIFVMRLKLFFTPHLCILSSLIVPNKYFNFISKKEIHYALLAIAVGAMSVTGVKNIREQHEIYGEYSNYALEELLTWVAGSTEDNSVFAGSMPITAAILLSTRRPIVNHPHYEDAALRERTKKVYSIYSRKPPEDIYKMLSSLEVEYVVISENWCFSNYYRGSSCTHVDLWDSEDLENKNRSPTCPNLYVGAVPYFHRVFSNSEYSILKLMDPRVRVDKTDRTTVSYQ